MDGKRAKELMKIERECVYRNALPFGCDRKCAECDIVQSDEELLAAYDFVIGVLENDHV